MIRTSGYCQLRVVWARRGAFILRNLHCSSEDNNYLEQFEHAFGANRSNELLKELTQIGTEKPKTTILFSECSKIDLQNLKQKKSKALTSKQLYTNYTTSSLANMTLKSGRHVAMIWSRPSSS